MRSTMYLVALGLAFTACATTEEDLSSGSQSVVTHNRLSVNRLAVNRLAVNRLAVNRLAVNRLAVNRFQLDQATLDALLGSTNPTIHDQDVELVTYIVSCALPEGVAVVGIDPISHVQLEFFGSIGLAPGWLTDPLDGIGKRWVSSCLLARVNAFDVSIQISMRGPHASLASDAAERADYSLEEGAFYGDVFRPATEPLIMIACRGRDQAAGETGGLIQRACAEPDPATPGKTFCGFTYAGDCGDYAPPVSRRACESFSPDPNTFYVGCQSSSVYGAGAAHGHHKGHKGWPSHTRDSRDHDGDAGDHGDDDHDDGDSEHDDDATVFHQVITTFAHP